MEKLIKNLKKLMSLAKKGKTLNVNTKNLISKSLGKQIYLYELVVGSYNSFSLIKTFNSGREAGRYFNTKFLNCLKTGKLYKNKYKFSYNKLK